MGRKKDGGSPWILEEGMVGLWKDIKKKAPLLINYSMFVVGNGRKVHFWRIDGINKRHFVRPFHCSMQWLLLKSHGWQRFQTV